MSEETKEVALLESKPIQQFGNTAIDLSSPEGIELQAKRIEKFMEVQGRIRRACVKMTNKHDWIDQDGKPYLQWQGAAKIAAAFGISYDTPRFTQKIESDEQGQFIVFEVETNVRHQGRSVPEIGSASTRDAFFGVRNVWNEGKKERVKTFLPLSEIDLNDVKKKALTNLLNRGIKSLLGISYSWDEIKDASGGLITPEVCSSVKHDKGKQGGSTISPETADLRSKVRKQILEICGGDETAAKAYLQKMTTWKDKEGNEVPGKSNMESVTDKQLPYLARDIQKEYDGFFAGKEAK